MAFIAAPLVVLAACAPQPQFAPGVACVTKTMTVTDQFDGARRGTCTVLADDHVRLTIVPEGDPPINDSPWYSFRIAPSQPGSARITLQYEDGHHRYVPKLSDDGRSWTVIDERAVRESWTGRKATFVVDLGDREIIVSAQELITPAAYEAWLAAIEQGQVAARTLLGYSRQGRPIYRLDVNEQANDVLLIIGRQHPPEVSGAFAFKAFAESLFGDSELAARFRERFRIIAVPLLNPDGVVAGNWRHNLGGVDLNRDWGPFTQPETQLMRDLLDALDDTGARVRVFLDFHSTNRNVFYTQSDDFPTDPPRFTPKWLDAAKTRIRDYEFNNDANAVSEQANSKNYMYKRYGIPTATYEVGDETDRDAAREAARIFAEELMKSMLRQGYAE